MKKFSKILSITLFYVLSWTWGFIMSFIGLCAVGGILFVGLFKKNKYKLRRHGTAFYIEIGKNWGGVELGMFFLCDDDPGLDLKCHESGHGLQNCLWGPLMPFVICIPSAIRYWLREQRTHDKKVKFTNILFGIITAVIATLAVIGAVSGLISFVIISGVLLIYCIILYVWLMRKEIPMYDKNKYVLYDQIWFEGQATSWGEDWYKFLSNKEVKSDGTKDDD